MSEAVATTEAVLRASGTTFAIVSSDGQVLNAGGVLAEGFVIGAPVADAFPLLVGMEWMFAALIAGDEPALTWPNLSLETLASGQVFDARLNAMGDGLILTLTERTFQAGIDQQVMQARNDLSLAKTALRQAREAAELANQSKDQLLLLLREKVREPLTTLITATHGLSNDLVGQDRALQQQAQSALSEGARLLELLDSLLEIADGAAGGFSSFVEELGAPRALQLAVSAAEKASVACSFVSQNLTAANSGTRLSLDPRRFGELVEALSLLLRDHGAERLVWTGPAVEGSLWILRLDVGQGLVNTEIINALRQPSPYIRTGSSPSIMHVALLLRATGITCQWQEESTSLRLAVPILKLAKDTA